jgi:hypothetical protein
MMPLAGAYKPVLVPRWYIPRAPHPVLLGFAGLYGLGAAQILPAGAVSTIASTIQTVEGYYPGSIAYQNNNPGNLVYAGQPGATAGAGGFAVFDSYASGWAALENQVQLYASRGLTISQMMNIYAPASVPGNNPAAYASTIAGALGVSPDTSLADLSSPSLTVTPADSASPPALDFWAPVAGGSSFLASFDPGTLGLWALGAGVALYALAG